MGLQELEIEHFRCLSKTRLQLSKQCNLIIGPNGAGKTSLLEAIYLLGSGRSFRTSSIASLIQTTQPEFLVIGEIERRIDGISTIGIRGGKESREFRVNGRSVHTTGELARLFPVQVIDPDVHKLVEDGPSRRRKFIDWGVFHVEHLFFEAWQRFNRALKQRNMALKERSAVVDIWDKDIISQGVAIDVYRRNYLESLRPFLHEAGRRLLDNNIDFEYVRGWRKSADLGEVLAENKQRDLFRGITSAGPHRAELTLSIGGLEAREHVSRGQQKLLACALILAQQLHRVSIGAAPACLLLDDPAAELDRGSLDRLLEIVIELPVQLVISALSTSNLNTFKNAKVFHVEHGDLRLMA